MLVLRRKEGQWTEIVNNDTGQVLKFRVYNIREGRPGSVHIAFDDPELFFAIQRPERFE